MSQDDAKSQNPSTWTEYKDKPVVWLTEYRTFGWLLKVGAYFSTIVYTVEGIDYEEEIENNEYELWENHAIDYESE